MNFQINYFHSASLFIMYYFLPSMYIHAYRIYISNKMVKQPLPLEKERMQKKNRYHIMICACVGIYVCVGYIYISV